MAKIGAGGYYRSRIVGAGRQGQGSTVPLAIREMALFVWAREVRDDPAGEGDVASGGRSLIPLLGRRSDAVDRQNCHPFRSAHSLASPF